MNRVVSDAQSNRRRKPGQDASHFKTDEDTGKMIIDDVDSNDEVTANPDDVAGTAYRESLTGVDGFTRGQGGRVKFNKDTKKRRRENEDGDGDVEMGDDAGAGAARGKGRKAKRPSEARLGHEFKAKVGHGIADN
jgi:ribosomal RNA-processing protein 12